MNALVGEKLSIITPKAQTTRHRIKGIINTDDYQIVFSDTPGILKSAYKLHDKMMDYVYTALTDADVLIYMVEAGEREMDEKLLERIKTVDFPVFVVINKIDNTTQEKLEELVKHWHDLLNPRLVIPISALEKVNTDVLLEQILKLLPEGPPYFDKEDLTDRPERFFVSEMIREKIFMNYEKEIPYSCEVVIEDFIESPTINKIRAVINVERESQKGIIIGHKGAKLKKVGTEARMDIERFTEKKAFLELYVKVKPDWRSDDRMLKHFGYDRD